MHVQKRRLVRVLFYTTCALIWLQHPNEQLAYVEFWGQISELPRSSFVTSLLTGDAHRNFKPENMTSMEQFGGNMWKLFAIQVDNEVQDAGCRSFDVFFPWVGVSSGTWILNARRGVRDHHGQQRSHSGGAGSLAKRGGSSSSWGSPQARWMVFVNGKIPSKN